MMWPWRRCVHFVDLQEQIREELLKSAAKSLYEKMVQLEPSPEDVTWDQVQEFDRRFYELAAQAAIETADEWLERKEPPSPRLPQKEIRNERNRLHD